MKRDISTCQFTPREDFANIAQFYPYYLSQHSNNVTRLLHFTGTIFAITNLIMFLYTRALNFLFYALISGYLFAWIGHMFFQRNKPAVFSYPWKSLLCDFIMCYRILTRQIQNDLKKYEIKNIKLIDTELF
jgi:hypothetical protein